MKTKFYFILFVLFSLLVNSCEIEELGKSAEINKSDSQRTFSLTASMPEESNSTRIALTLNEKSVQLTWEEGDQLQLLFLQGEEKVKQVVTVKNISADGKKADFDIVIPESFLYLSPFDLYGVYGGGGLSDTDPTLAILPSGAGNAGSLENIGEREDIMMIFSAKGLVTPDQAVNVTFRHLGSLFCIILKNLSGETVDNLGDARLVAETDGWAYNNSEGGAIYDMVNEEFTGSETAGNYISLESAASSLLSGDSISFWAWYPPLPDVNWPELSLVLNDSEGSFLVSSDNSKPERTSPADAGRSYYFYAVWTGTDLQFTDNTFTPPAKIEDLTLTGDLRHAEGGNGFIGIVYLRGGVVYYNEALESVEWSGEVSLGTGSDARMAVDYDNNPHVVYTTTDGKIAYISRTGSAWGEPLYIESNNSGSCSKPDIAIDGNGYAHITYTDTKGNTGDYTDHPDIMYAVNSSGSFVKTLIYNGYYNGWEQSYKIGHYYNKGSRITVDALGQYYILSHHQDHYRSVYSGTDNTYEVLLNSATASVRFGGTYGTDTEDIYDLAFNGTDVITLYKSNNIIKTSQLLLIANIISEINVNNIRPLFTNNYSNPATLLALPETRFVGGSSGTNLFIASNSSGQVYSDITVKTNTVAAVASSGNKRYIAYTDSDGIIKLKKIVI